MPLAKCKPHKTMRRQRQRSVHHKLITIITSRAFDSTQVARSYVYSSSYFDSISNRINGFTMVLSTHIIIIYLYQHIECYWTSNTLICWLCITMFGGHLAECAGSGQLCGCSVSLRRPAPSFSEASEPASSYENFNTVPCACKWLFEADLPMWTRCNICSRTSNTPPG